MNRYERYEAAIIGGGPAGLAAALVLGRMRRNVVLIDSGDPRNAASPHAHGFLTRDGAPPNELRQTARAQLRPYPVNLVDDRVTTVDRRDGGFEIVMAGDSKLRAERLILATGVRDLLPDIPGLRERWGRTVLHCPYCHGWETRSLRLVAATAATHALHIGRLLRQLSEDTTVIIQDGGTLDDHHHGALQAAGIRLSSQPLAGILGAGTSIDDLVLGDGGTLPCDALFFHAQQQQRSELPAALGCEINPATSLIAVNQFGYTTVPGVQAVGDAVSQMQQIVFAAADGHRAGIALNHELLTGEPLAPLPMTSNE